MAPKGYASRRVVEPHGVSDATVFVNDGVVERVVPGRVARDDVLDLGELVLSPGIVDCHVHMNEPGRSEWEGFRTATRAAAAGGVTSVVDMPLNSIPVTTTRAAFAEKLRASEGQCFVDVGFWGGVVPGNARELEPLARAGVLGCKTLLVHSGIEEFPNTTRGDLLAAMPLLRELGLPLLVHAELDLGAPPPATDPRVYRGYLESRPPSWEDAAIELVLELCEATGCAVHIVHLSSAGSLAALQRAKRAGLPVTVETCPHYLCLEAESIPDGATHYKCAPPIRGHQNREALWQGLLDGIIDFVISDHSPCLPELKLPQAGDFLNAWGGIASLQLGLSSIWTEAERRGASLIQLARWMSEAPARFAGLTRKGRIQAGYDADFLVWDPAAKYEISAENLFFRHRISPYIGRVQRGRVEKTLLGGVEIYDGKAHVGAPRGRALLHRGAVV